MIKCFRKYITEQEFESLKPFDNMAHVAEKLTGKSSQEYWFQVSFEVTKDCKRHGFAVLESHSRN